MALLICPECGNKVSSYASACPSCGCPTEIIQQLMKKAEVKEVQETTMSSVEPSPPKTTYPLILCPKCQRRWNALKGASLCDCGWDFSVDYGSFVSIIPLNDDRISRYVSSLQSHVSTQKGSTFTLHKGPDGFESILFGRYPQGLHGEIKPIEWIILEKSGDQMLLLSRYGLDIKPYHTASEKTTWETSTLRKWLNEDFLSQAFTAEEKNLIEITNVPGHANPRSNANPGNTTKDQIFLLSIPEVETHIKNAPDRICRLTKYAHAKTGSTGSRTEKWWLRSPGSGDNGLHPLIF